MEKMAPARIWFNVTSSVAWTRPPVGIIKVERNICAELEVLYGSCLFNKCVWHEGAFYAWAGRVSERVNFACGDVLLTLGLDWDYPYSETFRHLAQELGVRIISFCYDLVPIIFPQYCVTGVADKFKIHMKALAYHSAAIICISKQTEKDFSGYCRKMGYPIKPTHVITLGDSVPDDDEGGADSNVDRLLSQPFILFVSTIERRKNHEVLYRAYHEISRTGHGQDLPNLVFVGMSGWGVGDLLKDMELDPSVRGKIVIINHVSDHDLWKLYRKALFCVYPSLYEGWGLPIGEALAMGKAVLSSDRGSLPEVGGDLVRYLHPWDVQAWADAILDWVTDRAQIRLIEEKVVNAYVPRDWKSAALTVKDVADGYLRQTSPGPGLRRTGLPILARFMTQLTDDESDVGTAKMVAFDRSKPLAFFHVPKTGGSALNSAFRRALGDPKMVVPDQDRSLFGAYNGFESWAPDQFRRIILSPDGLDRDATYLSGHFAVSTILQGLPDAQFVTLLREPFSRLLSHWVYWRKMCEGNMERFGTWADYLRLALGPLHEFVSSPAVACQTDNVVVRMLLWPHPLIPNDDFIAPEHDDDLLRQAMAALDRFAVVGLYEDKGNGALFDRFFGAPLHVSRENDTSALSARSATKLFDEINEYTMGILMDRCRLDLKVWGAWAERSGLDADQVFLAHFSRNVSRFSLLLSGLGSDQLEREQLKQKVHMLEHALSSAQQVNDMLVQKLSEGFSKP